MLYTWIIICEKFELGESKNEGIKNPPPLIGSGKLLIKEYKDAFGITCIGYLPQELICSTGCGLILIISIYEKIDSSI